MRGNRYAASLSIQHGVPTVGNRRKDRSVAWASVAWTLSGFFWLSSAVGCGGHSKPAQLTSVMGLVTFDGGPLEGATIALLPTSGTTTAGAYAVTGSDGRFEVQWRGEAKGIAPGDYKVVVSRLVMPDGSPMPKGVSPTDAGAVEQLPPIYSDFTKATLSMTVTDKPIIHEFLLYSKPETAKTAAGRELDAKEMSRLIDAGLLPAGSGD